MRSILVLFATLLLLWTITEQANQLLAPYAVAIFLGGMYVTYAALRLPSAIGGPAVFLIGLVCDANAFLPFGTEALLFLALHLLIRRLRDRLPYEDTVGQVAIAWLANACLFLALSIGRAHRAPLPSAYWTRCGADLVLSQIVLALIAPWFFALQEASLVRAHAMPARRR